jgi:hypothetical protein
MGKIIQFRYVHIKLLLSNITKSVLSFVPPQKYPDGFPQLASQFTPTEPDSNCGMIDKMLLD